MSNHTDHIALQKVNEILSNANHDVETRMQQMEDFIMAIGAMPDFLTHVEELAKEQGFIGPDALQTFEINVRYSFQGSFTLKAVNEGEAVRIVTEDCGMTRDGGIVSTRNDVEWRFPATPIVQIEEYIPF